MEQFSSTLIYLSTFFISCFFYYIASKYSVYKGKGSNKSNFRSIAVLYLIIGIMIPCILAALRADTVGTDTAGYGVLGFKYLLRTPSLRYILDNYTELSFYVMGYGISRVTDNVIWILGAIELLIVAPVAIGGWRLRDKIDFPFFMLLFYFKFFNYSLCIMRESIACSFIFLAYIMYKEKKIKTAVALAVLAIFFHSTAFFGVAVVICAILYDRFWTKVTKGKHTGTFQLIIVALAIMFFFRVIVSSLLFLLPDRYAFLYNMFFENNKISRYGVFESAIRIMCCLIIIVTLKIANKRNGEDSGKDWNDAGYLAIIGIIIYVFLFLVYKISVGYRITEYADYFIIFYMTMACNTIKIRCNHIYIGKYILMLAFFLYWLVSYIIFPEGLGFRTNIYLFR